MARWLLPILLAAAACSPPSEPAGAAEPGHPGERPALRDALWDDGRAEVASYVAHERRYGILRDGEAILISVKEELDADALVKADGRYHPRTRTAMKLNTVLTVPTGVYTYRQMASSWLAREDARPLKVAVGSQEWCGLTYKVLTVRGPEALLRTFSYFGAEGERAFVVPVDERTVLADTLPLWLRTLDLAEPGVRRVRIVESQLSNRAPEPAIEDAEIEVGGAETLEVPAGRFETVPVEVRRGDVVEVFHLAREAPHTLVRWDRADGGRWDLEWVRRAAYWDMNGPEDVGAFDQGT